jgi:hypothetical protein
LVFFFHFFGISVRLSLSHIFAYTLDRIALAWGDLSNDGYERHMLGLLKHLRGHENVSGGRRGHGLFDVMMEDSVVYLKLAHDLYEKEKEWKSPLRAYWR